MCNNIIYTYTYKHINKVKPFSHYESNTMTSMHKQERTLYYIYNNNMFINIL